MRWSVKVGTFVAVCTVLLGAGGLWMLFGPAADAGIVGNANVLAAVLGAAALVVALTTARWWPSSDDRPAHLSAEQEQASTARLAREVLWVWREQARVRGIHRGIAPVEVRWRWSDADIAAPAADFRRSAPGLTTEGGVGELRTGLFETLPDGTVLVILGESGAGKTATVISLMIDVLEVWTPESAGPVPVLLPLAALPPGTSLLRWAAAAVARDFRTAVPGAAGPQVVAELIRRGRIVLLLDGLDELPPGERAAALSAVDAAAIGVKIVVTSRKPEYTAALAEATLAYAAVVELRPPDPASIHDYLITGLVGERRTRWAAVVDTLRARPEAPLATAFGSPLILTLARQTYAVDGDPAELLDEQRFPSRAALLRELTVRLLVQAYPEREVRDRELYWLSWLARRSRDRTDIAWWRIPDLVPAWAYAVLGGLSGGLAAGLAAAVTAAVWLRVPYGTAAALGAMAGLIVTVPTAVTAGFTRRIVAGRGASPVAPLRGGVPRMPAAAWRRRPGRLVSPETMQPLSLLGESAAVAGLTSLGVFGAAGFGHDWTTRALLAVATAVSAAVAAYVVGGTAVVATSLWSQPLSDEGATTPTRTYAGERVVGRTFLLAVVLGCALMGWWYTDLEWPSGVIVAPGEPDGERLLIWLWITLGGGAGVMSALAAGLLHRPVLTIRISELLLSGWYGHRIRFARLLATAHDRHVLRPAGGVYQFRHAAIREYLAELPVAPAKGLGAIGRRDVLIAVAVSAVLVTTPLVVIRDTAVPGIPKLTDQAQVVAFTEDGAMLAVGDTDGGISLVDVRSGVRRAVADRHTAAITSLSWAPDGTTLASTSDDDTVRVWDSSGNLRWQRSLHESGGHAVRYSPDGNLLAVTDGAEVRLWDVATDRERSFMLGHQPGFRLRFALGGGLLITENRAAFVPAGQKAEVFVAASDVRSGQEVFRLDDVSDFVTTGDGSRIAVLRKGRFSLVDAMTRVESEPVPVPDFQGRMALSGDGSRFAVDTGHHLEVFEAATGALQVTVPKTAIGASTFAFSPAGELASVEGQQLTMGRPEAWSLSRTVCTGVSYLSDPHYVDCP